MSTDVAIASLVAGAKVGAERSFTGKHAVHAARNVEQDVASVQVLS
jgi:hypothetical protein